MYTFKRLMMYTSEKLFGTKQRFLSCIQLQMLKGISLILISNFKIKEKILGHQLWPSCSLSSLSSSLMPCIKKTGVGVTLCGCFRTSWELQLILSFSYYVCNSFWSPLTLVEGHLAHRVQWNRQHHIIPDRPNGGREATFIE